MTADEIVLGLWRALSKRDFATARKYIADDCIYLDMCVGPTLAARGPDDIVKRIEVGWSSLAGYENHDGLLLSNGAEAMYEHSETWIWAGGESVVLPFVSVHRVADGKVTLWKDYWDFTTLINAAPQAWRDSIAAADTSWVFDATGLV